MPAQETICMEHRIDKGFFAEVCGLSPAVPIDSEQLWATGLCHGMNGDFASAVFILVPMQNVQFGNRSETKVSTL